MSMRMARLCLALSAVMLSGAMAFGMVSCSVAEMDQASAKRLSQENYSRYLTEFERAQKQRVVDQIRTQEPGS